MVKIKPYFHIMRPQKVIDSDLLNGLMEVLRNKGYDGTTLNDLAERSGLKKASLYHRFPGGKQEIATSVLQYVSEWLEVNLLQVLTNTDLKPKVRLDTVLKNTNQIYAQGDKTCILGAMCTSNALSFFRTDMQDNMNKWIDGFSAFGVELGLKPQQAKDKAIKVLVLIQGSLVVANTFDNTKVFQDALKEIKTLYYK
tara:strand:+ start:13105 stop:13695 length:591 start_codon:yes stop_codon:yes gene_type:complete